MDHLTCMKVPIFNSDFCTSYLADILKSIAKVLQEIDKLDAPQLQYQLIRNCASFCKINYLLRTIPPTWLDDFLEEYNKMIGDSVADVISLDISSDLGRKQMTMKIKFGGFGITDCLWIRWAAYYSSHRLAVNTTSGLGIKTPTFEDIEECRNVLSEVTSVIPETQREISDLIADYQFDSLLKEATNPVDKARLLAVSAPKAGAWLTAPPSKGLGTGFTANQWNIACNIRLGNPIFIGDDPCRYCTQPMDHLGIHSMSCTSGTNFTKRHNTLRDTLMDYITKASYKTMLEPVHLVKATSKKRPADILVHNYPTGKDTIIDVSIVQPCAIGYLKNSCVERLSAASIKSKEKTKSYKDLTIENDFNYKTFVMETFGGMTKENLKFLKLIAQRIAPKRGSETNDVLTFICRKISCSLQMEIANNTIKFMKE